MMNLVNAFILVVRRSLANWRLLSAIVAGVLVAVALLSSTPLYANALNDLGLRHALAIEPPEMRDIEVYGSNMAADRAEFEKNTATINQQMSSNLGGIVRGQDTFIQAQSLIAMEAGQPIPTGSNLPTGYLQSYTNLEKHVRLLSGRFPRYAGRPTPPDPQGNPAPAGTLLVNDVTSPDFEIEAVIGDIAAASFNVTAGDTLILFQEGRGGQPAHLRVHLVGTVEPIDPHDEFWMLRTDTFTVPSDSAVILPLFVPQDTILDVLPVMAPDVRIGCHWYYFVDPSTIQSTNAKAIAATVDFVETTIGGQIPNSTIFTRLQSTITQYLAKQAFTQVPLYLLVFQIAAIILYYVITVASMVIEQETGEIALLRSRGASTFQIFGLFLMEGLLISAIGGAAGPFLGASMFGLLGTTGPFRPLTGGGMLPVRFSPMVFILAGAAAGLCLLAFMVPAFQASRRGIIQHRQSIARPPRAPVWQRFYLDIALLVVGGGLYWELRQRGSLLTQKLFGDLGADPLMLITPLLFMLAVAIIFLRIFPLLVRLVSWLGRYVTNSVVVLTLRYMARNPVHYTRLILLLMMAASVGMFSASFLGTLNRSYTERVAYAAGTDIRLDRPLDYSIGKQGMQERYAGVAGVSGVGIAYRGSATVGTFAQTEADLLAVDPPAFANLAWYREDFSAKSLPELMAVLAKDEPAASGLKLPDGTEAIGLWVSPVYSPDARTTITARIEDGNGYYNDVTLGSPQYAGWQYIEGSLEDTLGNLPKSPVTLHAVSVSSSASAAAQGIYMDDLQARVPSSPVPVVIEDFEEITEWTAVWENRGFGGAQGPSDTLNLQHTQVHDGTGAARYLWSGRAGGFRGIFINVDARPITALASRSFMAAAGVSVGDMFTVRIPGQFLYLEVTDVLDYFPTMSPQDKPFLIVNYDRMVSVALAGGNRIYPNEVWLGTATTGAEHDALVETLKTPGYRSDELADQQGMLAAEKADPLVAAGWGGVLLIAFVGVILVSGLGFVVYAYLSARGRHLEFAILRTLGFSWKQIIALICFEQVFVIGIGMGVGTLLGSRLSRIMMPFLQLTEKGQTVVPPFVLVTDWLTIGVAYAILTVAFAATISLVALFFSRVALHRALRLGDQ